MKTIAIIAGGALDTSLVADIKKASVIIGVDFGAYWLIKNNIVPNLAVGDFDSVTPAQFKKIHKKIVTIKQYPQEKDATDLELAVQEAIQKGSKEVWIYGAIGSRFDHTFAGVQMLRTLWSHNICGYLVDKTNKISIVRRSLRLELSSSFRYVSIFALDKPAVVSLRGFYYDVTKKTFYPDSTLGVSNEIKKSHAHIRVHSGEILLVQSRD